MGYNPLIILLNVVDLKGQRLHDRRQQLTVDSGLTKARKTDFCQGRFGPGTLVVG
jgi:hypothetical protein